MTDERRPGDEDPEGTPPDESAPGDLAPEGSAAEEPAPPPRCAVCGAELDLDQTYCLVCGSPTPLAPRLRRGGRTTAILAGAMVVLGLGAGALAYAVVDDEPGSGSGSGSTLTSTDSTLPVVPLPPETAPTTGGLPPDTSFTTPTAPTSPTAPIDPTTTGFDTVTGPSTAPPESDTSTQPVVPPATTDGTTEPDTGSSDWPPGRTAWTAVLSSVRNESDARAAKSRLRGAGDDAGVLFSSDYPDLRAGYWVLFSGTYDGRDTAIAQATRLRPEFPGAYARRISG